MPEAQIAVLIDYENVGLDSIQHLFDQLSDVGRIIVRRAYADWSSQARRRDQVLELGIEAVHHFASRNTKNSSDICLVIDAVELLYGSPVDTFVIVSADTDFVPLASKLRAAGKTVFGAGRRDVVSPTLVRACDRYIYLEAAPKKPEPVFKPGSPDADGLLVRAMEAHSEGLVAGSKIHQTMTRIDPSFNFKDLGYGTFTRFLEGSSVVKVTRSRGQGDSMAELRSASQRGGVLPRVTRALGRRPKEAAAPVAVEEHAAPPLPAPPLPAPPLPAPPLPAPPLSAPPLSAPPLLAPVLPAPEETNGTRAEPVGTWDQQVHEAWGRRAKGSGDTLNGTWAAGEAARALGVPKLSASRYKTLQKLLDSSPELAQYWARDGNTLRRK